MIEVDAHGHAHGGTHVAHGPEAISEVSKVDVNGDDTETVDVVYNQNLAAQVIGVAILEFGVALHRSVLFFRSRKILLILHSVLIGLTLAVDEQFKVLFVVLIFHREYCSKYGRQVC